MKLSEFKKLVNDLIKEELDEMTTTGAVAGYATPFAFSKNKNSKGNTKAAETVGYKLVKELIRKALEEMTATGAVAGYATPFAFSGGDEEEAKKQKKTELEKELPGMKVVSENEMPDDEKIELVKEGRGRYYNFRDHPMKNHTKVSYSIMEINKMLQEIEYLTDLNLRLKKETQVGPDMYWKRTSNHLSKINKRLKKISKKVDYLGR